MFSYKRLPEANFLNLFSNFEHAGAELSFMDLIVKTKI